MRVEGNVYPVRAVKPIFGGRPLKNKPVEDLNVITDLKCNKLLNVITFGLKCNKLQSVTTFGLK